MMASARVMLATLLPSVAIYLLLRRGSSRSGARLDRALAAAVAPGLGIGFASCIYLLLLHLTSAQTAVRLDAGLWGLLDGWLLIDLKRRMKPVTGGDVAAAAISSTSWSGSAALRIPAVGFIVLVGLAAASFLLHFAVKPDGEWDAWAIWNLRSRAIARGAPDWAAVFSPDLGWSQPHYPLLVPLSVARLWAYGGGESTAVPAALALLFFLSTLAVVVIAVGRLRGWPLGLLSGMALLMSRTYVFQAACQCGDVPLGFYVLVAIGFAVLSREAADPGPLLLIAGMAAGFAAWTKNEGLLLLGLVVLAAGLRAPRLRGLTHAIAGVAVPALVLGVFKLQSPASNYLFDQQSSGDALQKAFDPSRWFTVLARLADLAPVWGAMPGGALLWLGLAVAITMRLDRPAVARAANALLLLIAMFAGYTLVYVITPLPLEWQISTSFDRLLVQLWPALVWTAFQLSGLRGPEPRVVT